MMIWEDISITNPVSLRKIYRFKKQSEGQKVFTLYMAGNITRCLE
jgi:hypothetical protein